MYSTAASNKLPSLSLYRDCPPSRELDRIMVDSSEVEAIIDLTAVAKCNKSSSHDDTEPRKEAGVSERRAGMLSKYPSSLATLTVSCEINFRYDRTLRLLRLFLRNRLSSGQQRAYLPTDNEFALRRRGRYRSRLHRGYNEIPDPSRNGFATSR